MATIYLSSTYGDLLACRQLVHGALCRMGHCVLAMEHYLAMDQRPLDTCLTDVATCDLYIGIFAWRYGYIPPSDNPEGKSITELEYRQTLKTEKSSLFFLLHEDAPWPPKCVDPQTGHSSGGATIYALRQELAEQFLVSYFHTHQELVERVSELPPLLWNSESVGYTLPKGDRDHGKSAKNLHTGVQAGSGVACPDQRETDHACGPLCAPQKSF